MSIVSKIMWGIVSLLFIAAGIWCFCVPADTTLTGLTIMLGVFLTVSGLITIITYWFTRKSVLGSGWILVQGILTLIIGIMIFFNTDLITNALPVMFAIWVLISGIIRFMSAFDMRRLGFQYWWINIVMGCLMIIFAAFMFWEPIVSEITMIVLTGIYLILTGIATAYELWFATRLESRARNFIKKVNSITIEPEEQN